MNRRVIRENLFSESRLVQRGQAEADEHGLGAGMPIGRHSRVRPLTRFETIFLSLRGGVADVAIPRMARMPYGIAAPVCALVRDDVEL